MVPASRPQGGRSRTVTWDALLVVVLAFACGLSPLFRGYYDPSVWGPIALALLAILLAIMISRPEVPRGRAAVALVGMAVLCAWSYLSIGWSASPDDALTAANRWLLYVAVFALFLLLLRVRANAVLLLGAAAGGVLVVALYIAITLITGDGPSLFLGGRLNRPLGYVNGQAGVLLLGLWPLVAMAEQRRPWLSPPAIAGATLIAALLVLTQARGVAAAAVVSCAVVLLIVPGRSVRVWVILVILACVAIALGPLLDAYQEGHGGLPSSGAARHAGSWALVAALVAGVVWAIAIWSEQAISRQSPRLRAGLGTLGRVMVVGLVLAGLVTAVVFSGSIARGVDRNYHAFVHLGSTQGSSRFLSGGGNRYDYWRVAVHEFRDHPVRGVGAGGYEPGYYLRRRTDEDIKQPHSVELQTLSELGLVGGAALVAVLGAVLLGLVRLARAGRAGLWERGLAVAAGGAFVGWLAHTSVDWLHLLPGVTGIALAAAAVLCTPWLRRDSWSIRSDGIAIACAVIVAGVAVLGALAIARPVIAQHARAQARSELGSDPRAALDKANEALAFNRYNLPAYYLKASAYARLNDYADARTVLLQAVKREPSNFITYGLLGDLAARRGLRALATAEYRRAHRLNPRDRQLARLAAGQASRPGP